MRLRLTVWAALALGAALEADAASAPRPDGQSPVGNWLTGDGDGVVQLYECATAFCGRIVGMSEPVRPDGRPVVDVHGQAQCGLTILRETGLDDTNVWAGKITDPSDGSSWNCDFWVEADGLHLRGYVLVPLLGKTQIWRRYQGRLGQDCRMG